MTTTLPNKEIIKLSDIGVRFNNRRWTLRAVNIDINEGDFMAITGPNGGGKTTLLRIILGLIKPDTGSVKYFQNGKEVKSLKIGYLPQKNMIDNRFPVTVEEVVASGLFGGMPPFHKFTADEIKSVTDTLEQTGMMAHRGEPIGNLSGGQLQRTLLGRAIISRPHVLVLDEPLSYIDRMFVPRLYEIIASMAPTSTILLVSHEMIKISEMATRHIIVDHTIHDCHASHHFVQTECE